MNINPFLLTDGYKVSHHLMYPEGTTLVYSNLTPRSNRYAPKGCDKLVVFGTQMIVRQIKEIFDKDFFRKGELIESINSIKVDGNVPDADSIMKSLNGKLKQEVCGEIKKEYSMYLGVDYDISHIEALWDLGYLPIEIKSLPEGTLAPMGVPVLTIKNTLPEFFWLTNFLETLISNLLWKPMTSATLAYQLKNNLLNWVHKTDRDNKAFVDFQGHDFSMRGLCSINSTISSGLGHATSFMGSDSLPVIYGARKYYDETGFVVGSVPATEHSVMCAGSKDDEIGTFRNLMRKFPEGIISVVSDTWDLWKVCTEYLTELKEEILARDGKLVIRPDSGNPVDIICGTYQPHHGDYSYRNDTGENPEEKGVIELLWDIFGGTINKQDYKVLDPHIGAIYGDSITIDRAEEICKRLEAKGFASTNIVLGVGSFTYQYNTRDSFGLAMKATYCEISHPPKDGESTGFVEPREIFKDPITDDGTKKSAKGLLMVVELGDGTYELHDQVDWKEESQGCLQTIFKDGEFFNPITLTEIRNKLKNK